MNKTLRSLAVAVLFAVFASPAAAEDRGRAESALKQGVKEFKLGQYEEALKSYQAAAELAPSAAGPFREMGKAYEALGEDENAIAAYSEYLRRRPTASDAKEIQERLAALEAKLPQTGALYLSSPRAGEELWVNGEPYGALPLAEPLTLPAGEHRIELRREDRITFHQVLGVGRGEARELYISAPSKAVKAPAAVQASPAALAAPTSPAPAPAAKKERHPGRWVALGLGVAAAAGAGFAFSLSQQDDGFEDNIQPRPVSN